MTQVSRLYVLLCGYEVFPKTVSTRGRGARFIMAEPISAYLVETLSGWVLVDTGVNTGVINDPQLRYQYYGRRGMRPPIVLATHELLPQLAQIGVRPADISRVILTHMHLDHTGGLQHFTHAAISIQRAEYDFAFGADRTPAFFECDYRSLDLQWDLREGDWEAAPGLEIIATRGHTPGHQSAVVQLSATGAVVLVGDAGDLSENFAEELLPGECADEKAALASIRRINQIVKQRNGQLFLCHDPIQIQQLRLAPDYYA
jgi:N-acyl homoserine lactone hydrolase